MRDISHWKLKAHDIGCPRETHNVNLEGEAAVSETGEQCDRRYR